MVVKKQVKKVTYRDRVRNSAARVKYEFEKQVITGVTAAFAFLIALSWREPIKQSVNNLIVRLGLAGQQIYLEYISAIVITTIAVFVLMFVSRWKSE